MENIVEDKLNLMNKLARALAKEENITVVQALDKIKKEFMDRDETAETIKNLALRTDYRSGNGHNVAVAPEDAYAVYSEQTKVELRKLDLQQKQIDTEQKRLDAEVKKQEYLDKKLEAEERMQREKLDRDERMQREKLDRDERMQREKLDGEEKLRREEIRLQRSQKEEENRVERERAHTEKLITLSTLTGKKGAPDEMMEYLKSQSESTKEFYKAQGESQKGLYETLLKTKDSERDREYEWKKELARIEAEREIEMAKLRQEDPKVASSTEILIDTLREQFENLGTRLTTNPADDFVAQIDRHNKFQESLIRAAMPILKAQGLSEEQMQKVKQQVGMEEKRQESSIGKLWDLGKLIYKDYIEPAADKATKELQAAPAQSGLENRVSPEIEKRIREETEAKARQIEAENKALQLQLNEEKKRIQEERRKLESKAHEIGIPYDDTITNQDLFYWIEHQEAVLERQKAEAAAMERQAALEREREERARRARATIPQQEVPGPVPEATIPEDQVHETEAETEPQAQASQEIEPLTSIDVQDSGAQGIHDFQEELAKPRETSQETLDFMKEVGGGAGKELKVIKPEFEPEPEPELEEVEKPEEPEPEQPPKKGSKKGKRKARPYSKYTVYNSDGTEIAKVESINHRNAGLKVANQLNGTPDNPVRISISDESGNQKQYDAYSAELENRSGKKYNVPRVKAAV